MLKRAQNFFQKVKKSEMRNRQNRENISHVSLQRVDNDEVIYKSSNCSIVHSLSWSLLYMYISGDPKKFLYIIFLMTFLYETLTWSPATEVALEFVGKKPHKKMWKLSSAISRAWKNAIKIKTPYYCCISTRNAVRVKCNRKLSTAFHCNFCSFCEVSFAIIESCHSKLNFSLSHNASPLFEFSL